MLFAKLRADIREVIKRDPAARSWLEVLLCYPGVHALFYHRIANFFWRWKLYCLARFLSHIARWLTGIEIHPAAQIASGVFIDHGMGVVIGETAVVGENCTIYQGVTLGGTKLLKGQKRHPTLGKNVIVGAGAQVLGSFTVGDNAKIGSNAVVTKPVPEGATVVGNPAMVIMPNANKDAVKSAPTFKAYAVSEKDENPLLQQLKEVIEQNRTQEEQLKRLSEQQEKLVELVLKGKAKDKGEDLLL